MSLVLETARNMAHSIKQWLSSLSNQVRAYACNLWEADSFSFKSKWESSWKWIQAHPRISIGSLGVLAVLFVWRVLGGRKERGGKMEDEEPDFDELG